MRTPHLPLMALALIALLASAAAMAGDTVGSTSGNDQTGAQLVDRYTSLAGSGSNARALIDGLRNGTEITLSSNDGDTTFTPATSSLEYAEINTSLALAQAELNAAGISAPTSDQLEAALNGGTVTLPDGGTVDLQGVLDLRANGEGWKQIAKDLGLKPSTAISS